MRGYGAAQGRLLGQRHRPSPLGAQVVTEGKENRAAQTIRLPARHNGMCGPLYRTPPGVPIICCHAEDAAAAGMLPRYDPAQVRVAGRILSSPRSPAKWAYPAHPALSWPRIPIRQVARGYDGLSHGRQLKNSIFYINIMPPRGSFLYTCHYEHASSSTSRSINHPQVALEVDSMLVDSSTE